jgi:hypothetical protein
VRYCDSIGLYAIDRPRSSCKWATAHCKRHCYNAKLYKMYKEMRGCEAALEQQWQETDGQAVLVQLGRKQKPTRRVRLMTRGEAFKTPGDVAKVADILASNPGTLFWIPTRAWRNDTMRQLVQTHIRPFANARVMASTDPTTTAEDWTKLRDWGWSTMYFGDDEKRATDIGEPMFPCPKTHKGKHGACRTCRNGCFSTQRVNVHLRGH